jgi:dipeptidyl aminopeptidase/acylaminoacyl peptidase
MLEKGELLMGFLRSVVCSCVVAMWVLVPMATATAEEDVSSPTTDESPATGPDFRQVLSLRSAGGPRVAPDGSAIVYTVYTTDWEANRYDREIWLARKGEEPFQLTRTDGKNSSSPRWSPDGRSVAFVADRGGDNQIWLISPNGGEARPLTAVEDGISSFEWSPDGTRMAVAITEPQVKERKQLEESYGDFAVEDDEFRMTHLWLLDVGPARAEETGAELPPTEGEDEEGENAIGGEDKKTGDDEIKEPAFRRLTGRTDFTVDTYRWSPDSTLIAFDHNPDPRVESNSRSDISVIEVSTGEVRALVELNGSDGNPHFSPDGSWILFSTGNGRDEYYLNSELAKVPVTGGEPIVLTKSFDEDTSAVAWLPDGIRFIALDRTHRRIYRLDPESLDIEPETIDGMPRFVWSVDFSADGRVMVFQGEGPDTLDEIYRMDSGADQPTVVTSMTQQTDGWSVGSREVVRWQSTDGAEIEGVVLKPEGFDPKVKHPLMVIIHGGPSWLSFPSRVYSYVYPVQQWLEKGAVILMPNYRGSAGYGETFRSLNVRNLGVGDAWDVLSGVDHLIEQGYVDPDRMGAMGWSQGGYISAFLTTTSDRFRGISVGAGISNWMTYYVNTDIHPFTRHYLQHYRMHVLFGQVASGNYPRKCFSNIHAPIPRKFCSRS